MARSLIPNSTQIPDVILDHWMAELSGAEFKVLLYIARRTYGFGKDSDSISLSQIANGLTKRDGTVLDRGTGASRSSVVRSLKKLEEARIIIRRTNMSESGREFEENTYSINLDWDYDGKGSPPGGSGKASDGSGKGVVSKSDHLVSKDGRGWSQNETRVVSKSDIQETDHQETDQETASSASEPNPGEGTCKQDADAALLEELISHGVGRTVAERLVRKKPQSCRRALEYLPYAEVKTTKGAWLANAIRDDYGPPPGYEQKKTQIARKHEFEARQLARVAREKREVAFREKKKAKLGVTLGQLEKTKGEALTAFNEFVENERARTARIAIKLSPRRRESLLAAFDKSERRLELFAAWMKSSNVALPQARAP